MRHPIICFAALSLALSLTGCDDGYIEDPVNQYSGDSYTVQIKGCFNSVDSWTGKYTVAAACFDGSSPYSLTQTALPSEENGEIQTLTLTNVSTKAKSIEIVVMSPLRERIATLYSYEIRADQRIGDTIKVDVGIIDVGMFSTINKAVFQGEQTNCARCHSAVNPVANLDLTTANAYHNLVGVQASADTAMSRVVAGNASKSFLYRVITEGDRSISYSHPALFVNESTAPFVEIIRSWIDSGAKE